jgi:hypothetical protein
MAHTSEHRKTDLDVGEQNPGGGEKVSQSPVELELAGHNHTSGLEVCTMWSLLNLEPNS